MKNNVRVDDSTLLALYISGESQTQIAKQLNLTKATVCRRMKTDTFQAMLSDYRKKALESVSTNLISVANKAAEVLANLLDSDNEWIQLQTACKILNLAEEYTIQTDVMDEVRKLKDSIEQ